MHTYIFHIHIYPHICISVHVYLHSCKREYGQGCEIVVCTSLARGGRSLHRIAKRRSVISCSKPPRDSNRDVGAALLCQVLLASVQAICKSKARSAEQENGLPLSRLAATRPGLCHKPLLPVQTAGRVLLRKVTTCLAHVLSACYL